MNPEATGDATTLITVSPEGSFIRLLALFILLALGAHLLLLTLSFVLHYYDALVRPGAKLQPLSAYAHAFVTDWWYGLAYGLTFHLGWLPRLSDPVPAPRQGPPILLVQGYMVNRACMFTMYWRLRRLGYRNVYTLNLSPFFGPCESMSTTLEHEIRRITKRHQAPAYVIAHSMGGLLTRMVIARDPEIPIKKLISLGSPYRGTTLAHFGLFRLARELRPSSELVRSLKVKTSVPVISIYSLLDNIVIPATSAAFGTRAVEFQDIGHFGLLHDKRVFAAVVSELPEPDSGAGVEEPDPDSGTGVGED